MAESALWDLAWKIGLPFVLVLTALMSGKSGTWRWGREVDAMRADFEARLAEVTKDRDFYRQVSFEALRKADRGLDLTERALDARERAP